MERIHSLLIGNFAGREFAPVFAALSSYGSITSCANISIAMELIAVGEFKPDVIVVAQRRPGEFAAAAFEQLHRAAPLAPVLGIQGTWCEGETRTGDPWPGMLRTYWHAWLPRWVTQFDRLASGRLPVWGLPVTCTEDERLTSALGAAATMSPKLIAIHTRSHDMANMLSQACAREGHMPIWADPRRPIQIVGAHAVIWDGTGEVLSELSGAVAQFPSEPILALIDFPRLDEIETALRSGASAVVSVPFLLGDLFRQLELLITQTSDIAQRNVA
jgi:hypothetical protein